MGKGGTLQKGLTGRATGPGFVPEDCGNNRQGMAGDFPLHPRHAFAQWFKQGITRRGNASADHHQGGIQHIGEGK